MQAQLRLAVGDLAQPLALCLPQRAEVGPGRWGCKFQPSLLATSPTPGAF